LLDNIVCTAAARPRSLDALRTSTVILVSDLGGTLDDVVPGGVVAGWLLDDLAVRSSRVSPATNWLTCPGSTLITSAPPNLARPSVGMV
jgi:hypothetical protein